MVFRSVTVRAVVALVFLIGFYVVGLGSGIGLLGGAYLIVKESHRIPVRLVGAMAILGGTLLWSLVPRRSKFVPPGPEIFERDHPRLFAVLREIASTMGQPMPAHVYLMPDVNAFVTESGGILGVGGRRVMGIGLGLLAADNLSQFRATVAHEFGHYAGGDTRLGPIIYATRAAMVRTIENLSGSWLSRPFVWCWKIYLRLTQAISRQQELVADEWSVRVAGKTAHVTGLRQEALHGLGFQSFLRAEVGSLVERGVRPHNLFEGYRHFSRSSVWNKIEDAARELARETSTDPFDSHPALEERIAYAEQLLLPDRPMDETPSTSLLERPGALEESVTGAMLPEGLEVVDWREADAHFGQNVLAGGRRLQARNPELTLGALLDALGEPGARRELVERTVPSLIGAALPEAMTWWRDAAVDYSAGFVAAELVRCGFVWRTAPGEPLRLERGEDKIDIHARLKDAIDQEGAIAELRAWLIERGASMQARVAVPEDERTSHLARMARVEIEPKKDGQSALVTIDIANMVWPRCCAICRGSVTKIRTVTLQVGFTQSQTIQLAVPSCDEHERRLDKLFVAKKADASTGMATLLVRDLAYAELLERVNA